jgi:hypothetical protein
MEEPVTPGGEKKAADDEHGREPLVIRMPGDVRSSHSR